MLFLCYSNEPMEVHAMEKKIAIYIRVSTREQAEFGYGLDTQEAKCREYAHLFDMDEETIELYKDDGYSAKDLKRPAMQQMMSDVKEGKINKIIVYKLDRLSRRVLDVYALLSLFKEYNCVFIAVLDHLDISTANGRMLVGFLAVISEWEQNTISERTIDGLIGKASKGEYPFSRIPFGWEKVNGKLQLSKRESTIIKDLASKYVYEAFSIDELRLYLEKEYGFKKNWKAVKSLLTSKRNIGVFEYHGKEYNDVIPQLLDKKLYKKVLEKAKHHEITKPNRDMYLFHSLVHCTCGSRCEHMCTVKKKDEYKHTYYYYLCPKCNKRVNQDKIFAQSVISLGLHINQQNVSEKILEYEKELGALQKRKSEILEDYVQGNITANVYKISCTKIKNRKSLLIKKIRDYDDSAIHDLIYADRVKKRKLIKEHIGYIEYDFEKMDVKEIHYK